MRKLLITCALVLGFCSPALAQEIDFGVAAGVGSLFAEEDVTFDTDNVFGSVQLDVLGLPIFNGASGVAAEASYVDGDVKYSFWSINRADVVGGVYGGSDIKFASNDGEGTSGDFDFRVVAGYRVAKNISVELYSLEENRPIAFAVLYRW